MVEQVPDEEDRNDLFSSRIKLLEKLIAERPYKPGGRIQVSHNPNFFFPIEAEFFSLIDRYYKENF